MVKYGILIHGGAGAKTNKEGIQPIMSRVVDEAHILLGEGHTAVDVACRAVVIMEDSGVFNAGIGSCLTQTKMIEMDAGIMDGQTMQCGGIGAIKNIKNPIIAAKNVMYESDHSLIVGNEALKFSMSYGIQKYDMIPTDEQLKKLKILTNEKFGTVGAIVIDKKKNIAAAVSTGGVWNKIPGRVGDSAIVGVGYYAKNGIGAAVATGNGDVIMKSCISKTICDMLEFKNAQSAADSAIKDLGILEGGKGGVIVIDKNSNIGISFNTETMSCTHKFSND